MLLVQKSYELPTEAASTDPESNFGVAARLNKEIPNSHILDQWNNCVIQTCITTKLLKKLLDDFGSDLDMVVMGVGTGGTLTGVGKRLKRSKPSYSNYWCRSLWFNSWWRR
jgi:cysteine synthase A